MEGVEEEFQLFKQLHPSALLLPVASTGAAAKILYENMDQKPDKRLLNDFAYMALFKALMKDI